MKLSIGIVLSFYLNETKRLLPTVITEGGRFYTEHLRGTPISSMTPAILGRGVYHLTMKVDSGLNDFERFFIGYALALAACNYKGLREWTWVPKDWATLAFLPVAGGLINCITANAEKNVKNAEGQGKTTNPNYSENQERARWVLKTVAYIAQACAISALMVERNGSIPLKPSLYFRATFTILARIEQRYIWPTICSMIYSKITDSNQRDTAYALSGYALSVIDMIVGESFVKGITGYEVQSFKTWVVLTRIVSKLAHDYLRD